MRSYTIALVAVLCLGLAPHNTKVFICTGPNAEAYHFSRNCRGLSNCKHTVKEVAKGDAIKLGRRICGWED